MAFSPVNHGFKKIDYIGVPGAIPHFELLSSTIELLEDDILRLNVYLTQDRDFVNIWFGLLDAFTAQCQLGFDEDPRFNFQEIYTEHLFRGYIENDEIGAVILPTLRIGKFSPQALRLSDDGKIECHRLSDG